MLLAQALIPLTILVALASALLCRAAARYPEVSRPSPEAAAVELAVALLSAGLLGTVAVAAFAGGYAGSLELAAWAGGSFLGGFLVPAVASILGAVLDDDPGRPAVAAPLTAAALALGAVSGLFGLASNIAGEGPWVAASLIAPAAGGAALASLVGTLAPTALARHAAGAAAGALSACCAVAGVLAAGHTAAVTADAAWSAMPLVVLACAIAAAAVALVPGTVMAASGRTSAPPVGAWLAAITVALAAAGAAWVLLPHGQGWAAAAAAVGAAGGLLLAHLGFVPGTELASPLGRIAPWAIAPATLIAAWLLGAELLPGESGRASGGIYGLTLAAAAAIGPLLVCISLRPLRRADVAIEVVALEAWARPGEAEAAVPAVPATVQPQPARPFEPAIAGLASLITVALALALAVHARHELLRLAGADPVAYAGLVQDLGLVPPGDPARYAIANDIAFRSQSLEEIRASIGDDTDFAPADVRFLLGADGSDAERFAAQRLASGALIPGEAERITGSRWPLPARLPLPGATGGTVLGALLAIALVAAVVPLRENALGPWRSLATSAAPLALLLAFVPAVRFLGPTAGDALGLLAGFALVGGTSSLLFAPGDSRPGSATAFALFLAGLALTLSPGAIS